MDGAESVEKKKNKKKIYIYIYIMDMCDRAFVNIRCRFYTVGRVTLLEYFVRKNWHGLNL